MLVNLSLECRGCLTLNGPSAVCTIEPAARYDITYGLLLLSKRQLSSTSVERYFPQSEFRGFIRASVSYLMLGICLPILIALSYTQVENVGEILCTHSQSDLGPVYCKYVYNMHVAHKIYKVIRLIISLYILCSWSTLWRTISVFDLRRAAIQ